MSYSQTNNSSKTITLQVENRTIHQVFTSITKQIGLRFSYNPNVLDEKMLISISVENKSLGEILTLILPDSVTYKQISDYIILTSARKDNVVLPEKAKEQEMPIATFFDTISSYQNIITIIDTVWVNDPTKNYDSILYVLGEIQGQLNELSSNQQIDFSQKGAWIIGISSGLRGEICFASEQERAFQNKRKISTLPLEFSFGYLFADKFLLGSGIKFVGNYTNFSFEAFNWGGKEIQNRQLIYKSLQFPIDFKYHFHIGKTGLGMFVKAGINFSVPLQAKKTEIFTPEEYPEGSHAWASSVAGEEVSVSHRLIYNTTIQAPLQKVNLLGNVGAGISYTFKFGLEFSLYGEYYTGMLNMARITIPYKQEQYNTIENRWELYDDGMEYVIFRGDYWNFGLEISYKFKKRK